MSGARRRLEVRTEHDAAEATRAARDLALEAGFGRTEAVQLATAVSEVASNLVRHAGEGVLEVYEVERGVAVEARDSGPGIPDTNLALTDGWSTGGSLGLGLPGARRLVDEFDLVAPESGGTHVKLVKWRPGAGSPPAPDDLAETAVARGPSSPWSAVVHGFSGGLLLAVTRRGADALRARPAAAPPMLMEAAGDRDVVIAVLGSMDGHVVWQAIAPASARVRRDRHGAPGPHVMAAPRGRAATFGLLRDDLLVLASFEIPDPPPSGPPQTVAGALLARRAPADGLVLAARIRRGVMERRPGT